MRLRAGERCFVRYRQELMGRQLALTALGYYVAVLVIVRFAGKRLAGQTTTFDLLMLIAMTVVLQNVVLAPGAPSAIIFVVTVLVAHKLLALGCAQSVKLRHLVRGKPRELVRDGHILEAALADEGISQEELLAGIRKLGHDGVDQIKLAVLEETGQISAVAKEK